MEKRIVMFPFAQLSMACGLNLWANKGYSVGAAAKSAAEIGVSIFKQEPTHAPIAWFFVGARLPFSWVLLAYPAFGILSVMAVRARAPQGALGSFLTSYANLVRAATRRLASFCGSEYLLKKEAAIMATVPTPVTPEIQMVNGQAVTTSLALASYFHKRHHNVIAKIESLDCSPEFRLLNFKETVYDRPNPAGGAPIPTPCYLLTRDGFAFVAMGFTGKKAAQFKEAYIGAFNAMEAAQALPALLAQLDQSHLLHTAEQAKYQYRVILSHWRKALYPMLEHVQSPLARELFDRFDAVAWLLNSLTYQINHSQPTSPLPTTAHQPGKGGRRHDY